MLGLLRHGGTASEVATHEANVRARAEARGNLALWIAVDAAEAELEASEAEHDGPLAKSAG